MLSGRGLPGPVVTLCVHGQGSSPCPAAARMGLWLLLAIPSFWGSSSQGAVQPSPASGGPALRALCSRPQLLGIQLSGRCAAVPSFWGSSSQGAVQPSPPSGRPALRGAAVPSFWGSSSQGSVQPGGGGGGAGQFWPGAPGLPVASGCFSCTAGGPSAMEACWLRASAPFHVCAIGLFVSHGNSQTMSR